MRFSLLKFVKRFIRIGEMEYLPLRVLTCLA